MSEPGFVPLSGYRRLSDAEMERRARDWCAELSRRRSVREFSPEPVPRELIATCLRAAGSAPSGANLQPWHFVAVSEPGLKRRIREAAEEEERRFYGQRASRRWLSDLQPFGTDASKPFLETAPWLVAIFARSRSQRGDGEDAPNYYVQESVGIATGFLIAALHHAGLATLTHTPSPMRFLHQLLERPSEERAFLLLVVGHPAEGARVPDIRRKRLEQFAEFR